MSAAVPSADTEGLIFDVDSFAVHDGPGIRMAVYLKGWPLACAWCHSPESRRPSPELIFVAGRCTACGRCVEVCPQGVFEMRDKRATITDKDLCMECGACAKNCDFNALSVNAGVGCAAAIITGLLTGTEPTCGCSDTSVGCC